MLASDHAINVHLSAERIDTYLESVRAARDVAESNHDTDSVDLMTTVVTEFERGESRP